MSATTGTDDVALVPAGEWEVDGSRSNIGFDVRHLLLTKVRGRFCEVDGLIRCDAHGVTSIEGSVAVDSIDTGDARRDARLRDEDFFDAARYPRISLVATSPPVRPGESPVVRGTVTLRDISRPFELRVRAPVSAGDGNGRLCLRADGAVSRADLGLEWDSAFAAGGLVINDRVALHLEVVLAPRAPAG